MNDSSISSEKFKKGMANLTELNAMTVAQEVFNERKMNS